MRKNGYKGYDYDGGGIYISNSSAINLTNVSISGNECYNNGGGIYISDTSAINMTNIMVSNNYSDSGGGIYIDHSVEVNLNNIYISENDGGGIYISNGSKINLKNVNVSENKNVRNGGGIYISNSSVENIINGTISGNESKCKYYCYNCNGGGLYIEQFSSVNLTNVDIIANRTSSDQASCEANGGGLHISANSTISLANVVISENIAFSKNYDAKGGGIYLGWGSNIIFNNKKRCNIFFNKANYGNDIYNDNYFKKIELVLDTFSVLSPRNYFAHPIENYSFDILNGKIEQINSELYVSPNGDDTNIGNATEYPLKHINYAIAIIKASKNKQGIIHLDEGTYSLDNTEEIFPIVLSSYIKIKGKNTETTKLDAQQSDRVFYLKKVSDFNIESVLIYNGYSEEGGGILITEKSIGNLLNVTISNNKGKDGGGIYISDASAVDLTNVNITENMASTSGGGIYISDCSISLANVNRPT